MTGLDLFFIRRVVSASLVDQKDNEHRGFVVFNILYQLHARVLQ